MTEPRFRILSIDGGGIKGVFPASFLSTLEEHVEGPIGRYFDLIAGTSTGGIIALGLAVGLSAEEILAFYEKEGPRIFPRSNVLGRWIRHWFIPKYSSETLRRSLETVFGDKKIRHCHTRIFVPSMNLISGDIHIFKTRHHPKIMTDDNVSLVDAALATAAAPSYFPHHITGSRLSMIDGGMWANNPTGLAVVEAITACGVERDCLEVLSVGCTETPLKAPSRFAGKLRWANKAIDATLLAQAFASAGTAKVLAGNLHVHRFTVTVPKHVSQMDNASNISALRGLGYHEARKALPTISDLFFRQPAPNFLRVHAPGEPPGLRHSAG